MMIGIPVNRTISWTFALGACFAAVAGILNGSLYGSVKFDMGVYLGVKGFVAAVIGGLDNPRGAIFGGMLLALLETLVVGYVPSGSAYRDIIAFSLLLAFMLFRPTGFLGSKV
jgi:branched-chain amino acid transport system permease protein